MDKEGHILVDTEKQFFRRVPVVDDGASILRCIQQYLIRRLMPANCRPKGLGRFVTVPKGANDGPPQKVGKDWTMYPPGTTLVDWRTATLWTDGMGLAGTGSRET